MRDKINWTWKRIVGTVLGILGIGTLTSCYGVYEDADYNEIFGKVTGRVNGTEQPIEGIRVYLTRKDEALTENTLQTNTSSSGYYKFMTENSGKFMLTFVDVDGTENGSFKTQRKEVSLDSDEAEVNVSLEEEGESS